jgi:hypothetical protein
VVLRTDPVSALVNVTVTFGINAPDGSDTVPDNAPVEAVCASIAGMQTMTAAITNKKIFLALNPIRSPLPLSLDLRGLLD